jgi:hypothetical protein
MLSGNCIEFN